MRHHPCYRRALAARLTAWSHALRRATGGRWVTSIRAAARREGASEEEEWEEGGSGGGGRGGGGAHKESRSPGGRVIPRTMCAERLGQFVTLALVFATLDPARGTDSTHPPEGPQDRGSQQKGRLSLQNTGKRVRPAARSCRGRGGRTGCMLAARRVPFAPSRRPELTPGGTNSWWLGTCRGKSEAKRGLAPAARVRNRHVLAG